MRSLLKETERRRLEIVEWLTRKATWVTTSELSDLLNSSQRIVKEDIAHLRHGDYGFTIESSYHGFAIRHPFNSSIKKYYEKVLENSQIYEILELVFFWPNVTPSDLQEELFMSQSTYYRLIRSSNEVLLKDFNISIDTYTASISGDEDAIRYFYWTYIQERFSLSEWPFPSIDEQAFNAFVLTILGMISVKVSHPNLDYLRKLIAVNLTRYLSGNHIDLKAEDTHLPQMWDQAPQMTPEFYEILRTLNIHFTPEMIIQIFGQFLQLNCSLTFEQFEADMERTQPTPPSIQFLSDLLDQLSEKHKIPLPNKEHILWYINNNAYNEGFIQNTAYIYYNPNADLLEKSEKYHPEFFKDLTQGITAYRQLIDKPMTQFTIEHLVYQVCVNWKNLYQHLYGYWINFQALFVSNLSSGRTNLILDDLQKAFFRRIQIELFSEMEICITEKHTQGKDLVISTYPLPQIKNVPVFVLSSSNLNIDVPRLYHFVEQIAENNENA